MPQTVAMSGSVDATMDSDHEHDAVLARAMVAAVAGLLAWWLLGGGWRAHPTWPTWARACVELTGLFVVPFGPLAVAFVVWAFRKSTNLRVRDEAFGRAFVAPVGYLIVAAHTVSALASVAFCVGLFLRDMSHPMDQVDRVLMAVGIVMLALVVLWIGAMVGALFRPLGIELQPWGVRVANIHGCYAIPWEALARWQQRPGAGNDGRLRIDAPELVSSRGAARRHPRRVWVPNRLLSVRPVIVIDAINHYLAYPQYRPHIGTLAEFERLSSTPAEIYHY
jgi:hypothetical protein